MSYIYIFNIQRILNAVEDNISAQCGWGRAVTECSLQLWEFLFQYWSDEKMSKLAC